jgi:hypothetical protein
MKKFIIILILTICFKGELIFGQIIFSNGTGGGFWDTPSTWSGGIVPQVGNDVIIQGTDSVYTASNAQCNNLTISSGARFATGLDAVTVAGQLTLEADAYFYNQAEAENTLPGASIFLDPASTVVHIGAGSVGGEGNLEFGNLIIQRNAGVTCGGNLIINGNLSINMDAQNRYVRAADDEHADQIQTVHGNVYIHKGTMSCVDAGDVPSPDIFGIWNIMGNIYVYGSGPQQQGSGITPFDARIGPFSSASVMGTGIFNIEGDLIIDGGRLHAGTSSTQGTGTGIINLGGDLTLTANSNVSTTHLGPFALNFVGNGTQTVTFGLPFSMNTNVFDTIKAGSNVVFNLGDSTWRSTTGGDFVVNGSLELVGNSNISGVGNFTLNPGGTLKIGSPDGISAADPVGNIQVIGTRTFGEESNYEYKGSGTQSLGTGFPSTVNGFAVNNPDGIVLDRNLTVNGSVNTISGDLNLNGNTIQLGEDASLTESAGNTVTGTSGMITTSRNIGTPSSLNVGGLGAVITSGVDLGNTTVERFHSAAAGNGNQGILRQFNIMPANNSGLDATLRLYYDESELNGLSEDGLGLFKSPDGTDDSWAQLEGTANTDENYVELSGISDLSYWTIANNNTTLPVEKENGTPDKFSLHQNYPNPFNPETTIEFELPAASFVNITVYNTLGEKVATIQNGYLQGGYYKRSFNAISLPSGVYFYRLSASGGSENFKEIRKMVFQK